MISKMAIGDIEALQDDGIKLTPEEIIRLNAFGLKVERNSDSAEYFVLPRVSMLGDVVFHEPTIGSEIWLAQAGKMFDMEDSQTYIQLRAYSLGVPTKELPDPFDKEVVKEKVAAFFKDKLGDYTIWQVNNALEYAVFGNNPAAAEKRADKAIKKENAENDENDEDNYCYEVGLLRQGIIYGFGNKEQIKEMTASEIQMFVEYQLQMKFGSQKTKSEHSKNIGEYYAVLDEIKENHKKSEGENK